MQRFIQLHLLTNYPPSNLNRDDLGRPKTAIVGGTSRLRISSQSLKRAWRTSDIFESALKEHKGNRTRVIGKYIFDQIVEKEIPEKQAREWAKAMAGVFGKNKKDQNNPNIELEIEQLAHVSPEENQAIDALIQKCVETGEAPTDEDLKLLRKEHSASDIAMFGRMLAAEQEFNVEAAVQVAHAITVHPVEVDDDFFTAVDDLNKEDSGAGHMGVNEFGAGVFYLYICINRELLLENLNGNKDLLNKTLNALVECAAKVSPTGKQNSYASRAYASFILAEKGNQQPRSLSVSFLSGVSQEQGTMRGAIEAVLLQREKMEATYGKCADSLQKMDVDSGEGTLQDIMKFVREESI